MARSGAFRLDYPSFDLADLDPGQIDPLRRQLVHHEAGSVRDVPDPRRVPETTSPQPAWPGPRQAAWRVAPGFARPQDEWAGVDVEPAYPAAIGIGGGGAPTGAASGGIDTDAGAHLGFNRPRGRVSPEEGVRLLEIPARIDGRLPDAGDPDSHLNPQGRGLPDPRHEQGQHTSDEAAGSFDLGGWERVEDSGVPGSGEVSGARTLPLQKPPSFFTEGRPARHVARLFLRPFDQRVNAHLTGDKIYPQSPPTFGSSIKASPHASMPIRTDDEAPHGNSPVPTGPAPGMNPVGIQANTWRLQPQPWDEFLVNPGP